MLKDTMSNLIRRCWMVATLPVVIPLLIVITPLVILLKVICWGWYRHE